MADVAAAPMPRPALSRGRPCWASGAGAGRAFADRRAAGSDQIRSRTAPIASLARRELRHGLHLFRLRHSDHRARIRGADLRARARATSWPRSGRGSGPRPSPSAWGRSWRAGARASASRSARPTRKVVAKTRQARPRADRRGAASARHRRDRVLAALAADRRLRQDARPGRRQSRPPSRTIRAATTSARSASAWWWCRPA